MSLLTRDLAQRHAWTLADLLNTIPQCHYAVQDVLAETKRGMPLTGRWEHSWILVAEGTPCGVLLTSERAMEPASSVTRNVQVYPHKSFYLDALAVHKDLHGQGWGKRLLGAWLERTKQHGFAGSAQPPMWSLQTNAASWNASVQTFYQQAGFVKVGHKDYENRSDLVYRRR